MAQNADTGFRDPHYSVGATTRDKEIRGTVGHAFLNDDGTITVKLNPFVVLDTAKYDIKLTLFPLEKKLF